VAWCFVEVDQLITDASFATKIKIAQELCIFKSYRQLYKFREAMNISLNKIKMTVIKTSENGVVNKDTIFAFTQTEDLVTAEYAGGQIKKGFLVGNISERKLKFSYCQIQNDGKFDNGISSCELFRNDKGKIRLTEHFEWKSRPGEMGINVFEEL